MGKDSQRFVINYDQVVWSNSPLETLPGGPFSDAIVSEDTQKIPMSLTLRARTGFTYNIDPRSTLLHLPTRPDIDKGSLNVSGTRQDVIDAQKNRLYLPIIVDERMVQEYALYPPFSEAGIRLLLKQLVPNAAQETYEVTPAKELIEQGFMLIRNHNHSTQTYTEYPLSRLVFILENHTKSTITFCLLDKRDDARFYTYSLNTTSREFLTQKEVDNLNQK